MTYKVFSSLNDLMININFNRNTENKYSVNAGTLTAVPTRAMWFYEKSRQALNYLAALRERRKREGEITNPGSSIGAAHRGIWCRQDPPNNLYVLQFIGPGSWGW